MTFGTNVQHRTMICKGIHLIVCNNNENKKPIRRPLRIIFFFSFFFVRIRVAIVLCFGGLRTSEVNNNIEHKSALFTIKLDTFEPLPRFVVSSCSLSIIIVGLFIWTIVEHLCLFVFVCCGFFFSVHRAYAFVSIQNILCNSFVSILLLIWGKMPTNCKTNWIPITATPHYIINGPQKLYENICSPVFEYHVEHAYINNKNWYFYTKKIENLIFEEKICFYFVSFLTIFFYSIFLSVLNKWILSGKKSRSIWLKTLFQSRIWLIRLEDFLL